MNIKLGITDHLDPEVQAMLIAMYSRSYAPIESRIPNSTESSEEHKKKLGKYYVDWGHKAVGQLGYTTVWIEGVSQLAAKAIENHPLFNGQESSTRYMDFSNQVFISENTGISLWQETFRKFYINTLPLVVDKIKEEFPFENNFKPLLIVDNDYNKNKTKWENTVKARAFDICRGLLPAGITTNVGFLGTFDTINDHFGEMLYHPSIEMRDIAKTVLTQLKEKYKYGAFSIEKLISNFSYVSDDFFYDNEKVDLFDVIDFEYFPTDNISDSVKKLLAERNKFDKLPSFQSNKINLKFKGLLDFGSYRDLHRHRNGKISMNMLTTEYGFENFYSDNLPEQVKVNLKVLLNNFENWYNSSDLDPVIKQYAVPMGYRVPTTYTADINQIIYIIELRSGKTVHQTLRKFIHKWVRAIENNFQYDVKLYPDMDIDNFTLKRGEQTLNIK